jgi:hypothetical protein
MRKNLLVALCLAWVCIAFNTTKALDISQCKKDSYRCIDEAPSTCTGQGGGGTVVPWSYALCFDMGGQRCPFAQGTHRCHRTACQWIDYDCILIDDHAYTKTVCDVCRDTFNYVDYYIIAKLPLVTALLRICSKISSPFQISEKLLKTG